MNAPISRLACLLSSALLLVCHALAQVQRIPLKRDQVNHVAAGTEVVTTVQFPQQILGLEGAFVAKTPSSSTRFLLNFEPGQRYFSVRALTANASANLNVVLGKEIYAVTLSASTNPLYLIEFLPVGRSAGSTVSNSSPPTAPPAPPVPAASLAPPSMPTQTAPTLVLPPPKVAPVAVLPQCQTLAPVESTTLQAVSTVPVVERPAYRSWNPRGNPGPAASKWPASTWNRGFSRVPATSSKWGRSEAPPARSDGWRYEIRVSLFE